MKACNLQTEANLNLCSASEEAILHIWSDVKITHSTLTDSVAYTKGQFGTQGGTMLNEKCFSTRQIL